MRLGYLLILNNCVSQYKRTALPQHGRTSLAQLELTKLRPKRADVSKPQPRIRPHRKLT